MNYNLLASFLCAVFFDIYEAEDRFCIARNGTTGKTINNDTLEKPIYDLIAPE